MAQLKNFPFIKYHEGIFVKSIGLTSTLSFDKGFRVLFKAVYLPNIRG